MRQVDYIVVGLGIAGIAICEALLARNRSFVVYDRKTSSASRVAAGVINPTVLKRFTAVWEAQTHVTQSAQFYQALSSRFQRDFITELPIYRVFNSVEEQNRWMVASDRAELKLFLAPSIDSNPYTYLKAPFGLGRVLQSSRVDTQLLIDSYRAHLLEEGMLYDEHFSYDLFKDDEGVAYQELTAEKILFTEGALVRENPFFPAQWLIPNKGDYLIIEAPDLKVDRIIKGPVFIVPLGADLYKVGATFDKGNDQPVPDPEKRQEIEAHLEKLLKCPYTVVDHIAGVRPTTKDRRPLLGRLPEHSHLFFMAGMGTRGIMAAPSMAELLISHIENGTPLPEDIDINRFG